MKLSILATVAVAGQRTLAQAPKSMDMAAQTALVAPNPVEFDKQHSQMREHMQQMQAQMNKIQQTQDPQERQRLLPEHWNSMQAGMASMHGMWGPAGAGCCAGGTGMGPGMMMSGPMMGWGHMRATTPG